MTPVRPAARWAWTNERKTAAGSVSGRERREARQRAAAAASHCWGSREDVWEKVWAAVWEEARWAAAMDERRGSRWGVRPDATMGSV